jgi:hypothetical protein
MEILFCSDPQSAETVEEDFRAEREAAMDAGFTTRLLDEEGLDEGDPERAARRVPRTDATRPGIYRGWMLTAARYAALHAALRARGLELINTPRQYRTVHHLPECYPLIERCSPRTVWIELGPEEEPAPEALEEVLAVFGDRPLVLKDYVKSQKHYWEEACYIPSAADLDAVRRVVRRFLELQGEDLQGGLVFREFVELEPLATHSRSGMPLTLEHRVFVLDGRVLALMPYWEEGRYDRAQTLNLELFSGVLRAAPARFYTMDIAKRRRGGWMLVELGDGQVSALPACADVEAFYEALRDQLAAS